MSQRHQLLFISAFLLATTFAVAQDAEEPGELPSLEEIDRQLNNPLSKQWALTLQDNLGVAEGDLIDGKAYSNLLFFNRCCRYRWVRTWCSRVARSFRWSPAPKWISRLERPTDTPPVSAIFSF